MLLRSGSPRRVVVAVLLSLLAARCAARGAEADGPPVVPRPGVESVLEAFDRHRLVGLGELHGNQDVHDFILSLVKHPRFAEKASTVVVEFGNARYQPVIDDYVAGRDVPIERAREAWRNTVNPLTWDSPVYERFFREVREMNVARPEGKRLRVLLGDVPVDWGKVEKMADLGLLGSRDQHFAGVVQREVLDKGRRALLVAGQWHLYRRNPCVAREGGVPEEALNTAELLLRRDPGVLWVVQPMDLGPGAKKYEPRFSQWEEGSVTRVRGTWIGTLGFGAVTPMPDKVRYVGNERVDLPADAPFEWPAVQEALDAYLWLGPKGELRWKKPDPSVYDDGEYLTELRRRGRLMGYPRAHFKSMTGHDL